MDTTFWLENVVGRDHLGNEGEGIRWNQKLKHRFLIINQLDALISQIYFVRKLYMLRTVPLSIIRGFFHCTHSNGICHTGLLTACKQDQDGTAVQSWSCFQAISKPVWHIPLLCVQWKTPDDEQRNFPKHVEFPSKINLRN